jgi:hypothetical protein
VVKGKYQINYIKIWLLNGMVKIVYLVYHIPNKQFYIDQDESHSIKITYNQALEILMYALRNQYVN